MIVTKRCVLIVVGLIVSIVYAFSFHLGKLFVYTDNFIIPFVVIGFAVGVLLRAKDILLFYLFVFGIIFFRSIVGREVSFTYLSFTTHLILASFIPGMLVGTFAVIGGKLTKYILIYTKKKIKGTPIRK